MLKLYLTSDEERRIQIMRIISDMFHERSDSKQTATVTKSQLISEYLNGWEDEPLSQ
jgi:hypothetical protein